MSASSSTPSVTPSAPPGGPHLVPVEKAVDPVAREKKGKRGVLVIGLLLVLAVGGYFGYRLLTSNEETTDDAIVDGDWKIVVFQMGN